MHEDENQFSPNGGLCAQTREELQDATEFEAVEAPQNILAEAGGGEGTVQACA